MISFLYLHSFHEFIDEFYERYLTKRDKISRYFIFKLTNSHFLFFVKINNLHDVVVSATWSEIITINDQKIITTIYKPDQRIYIAKLVACTILHRVLTKFRCVCECCQTSYVSQPKL